MKTRLRLDRQIRTVDTTGATLDEAVAQAAALLGLSVRRLEYEVTTKGANGVFGAGRKPWTIHAYERVTVEQTRASKDFNEAALLREEIPDVDGDFFVRLSQDGAYLKVKAAQGRGKPVSHAQVQELLKRRNVSRVDEAALNRTISAGKGEYIKIGSFQRNPSGDSMMKIDITNQEMQAFIQVTPPGLGGCDLSADDILHFLKSNAVVHGIKEDFVQDFADRPTYNEKILVAEGTQPRNGRDAYMQYNFETDQSKVHLRESENGKVDFKDLNIIQNVVEHQPLARKVGAEDGTPGSTVTGKMIPAAGGKDIEIPLGKNVHIANDGVTVIADINGQVVVINGKIYVEEVYTVEGNVNLKTGNVIFLGTVMVKGTVEDGFTVKAAGNIEVYGTVEKADLDAEGDIIVHQGITGKGGGSVKAGHSVFARFIENAQIEAGNMVLVSDGIVNSQIDAERRIICQGKKANVVGGRLRAREEINANQLGSAMGSAETICEVGYNPKQKERLDILAASKSELEDQLNEIRLNIATLLNIKKQRKSLPEDKELYLRELQEKRETATGELAKVSKELDDIKIDLETNITRSKISASSKVYPGVKIKIRNLAEDVRNEYRAVTFILENELIRAVKYEEPEDTGQKKD
jgi:uncharacterized protein (DUF342 family)